MLDLTYFFFTYYMYCKLRYAKYPKYFFFLVNEWLGCLSQIGVESIISTYSTWETLLKYVDVILSGQLRTFTGTPILLVYSDTQSFLQLGKTSFTMLWC